MNKGASIMMDYANNYRTWIKDKCKSLEAKELRYQTRHFDTLRRFSKNAQNQLVEAQHQLKMTQLHERMQANLLREI